MNSVTDIATRKPYVRAKAKGRVVRAGAGHDLLMLDAALMVSDCLNSLLMGVTEADSRPLDMVEKFKVLNLVREAVG